MRINDNDRLELFPEGIGSNIGPENRQALH